MRVMRPIVVLALWLAVLLTSAAAAELVMFRRDGCPYCAAWDREVGRGYGKSEIGRRVPLRMADIHRDRGTFWGLLERLVQRLPPNAASGLPAFALTQGTSRR